MRLGAAMAVALLLAAALPSAPVALAGALKPAAVSCPRLHPRCHRRAGHRGVVRPRPRPRPRVLPPQAITGGARDTSAVGAELTALVDGRGRALTAWFEYGSSTAYGLRTQPRFLPAGWGQRQVQAELTGLRPLTAYHFRLVVSTCYGCAAGTRAGGDQRFTSGGYANPVYTQGEGADPFVIDNGGMHDDYWAFTTGDLFPVLHSTDLVHWVSGGTAFSELPSWVQQQGDWHPWAPSVIHSPSACPGSSSPGCFVMYYVGVSASLGFNCVAVATSPSVAGPYADQGPLGGTPPDAAGRQIGCGDNQGFGMIDPSPFVDPASGQAYLYASEDFACPAGSSSCTSANAVLRPTISVIPLGGDLMSAAGPRQSLFTGDAGSWEAAGAGVPTVEGPSMLVHGGVYYLLYSGGSWHTTYGMGYATAAGPTGPFTKGAANPIMTGTDSVLSPGGGEAPLTGPLGGTWMVYHGRAGSFSAPRTLRLDPFSWRSAAPAPDVPMIGGPSTGVQSLQP